MQPVNSHRPLWQLSIRTAPQAEDAVTEFCQTWLRQPASSYTDLETGQVTVSVYLSKPIRSFRARLRQLRAEDWAESWKRHFKPLEIGSTLLVKPSWSRRKAKRGQATLILDPGLSFGTGQHPTTAFCLQQLAACRIPAQTQALLDIGTGSGILAIAASKLGYSPVDAFDIDPESVRVARANAARNGVLNRISIFRKDLSALPRSSAGTYDVVCANLISTLLLSEQTRILQQLKPGAMLVVAGILRSEHEKIQDSYESAGLRLVASSAEKEWWSGAFLRTA